MGLLAKAEAYLQWEAEQRLAAEHQMAQEQLLLEAAAKKRHIKIKTTVKHVTTEIKTVQNNVQTKLSHLASNFKGKFKTAIKKAYQPKLRRYAAMVLALGIGLQTADPRNMDTRNLVYRHSLDWLSISNIPATVQPKPVQPEIGGFVDIFAEERQQHIFTEEDRDDLARLLYGESGYELLDNIEVLHTALNRYASPYFKGTLHDILTAKNQFLGFKSEHPVLPEFRTVVDVVVDDFEANGCKEIEDCNRFYFVADGHGNNKYEIAGAKWVEPAKKVYVKATDACPTALRQAQIINQKLAQIHTQRIRVRGYERSI